MAARIGFGTLLAIETATPGTYTVIGGITAIKPPGMTADVLDRTTMQSPDRVKQKLGGLKDWGQSQITLLYDPADTGHADLIEQIGVTHNYQVQFPTGERWNFAGVGSSFEVAEIAKDGLITATFTVDVDGAPTFVPAAG